MQRCHLEVFTRLRMSPETLPQAGESRPASPAVFQRTPVVPRLCTGTGPRMQERWIDNGAKLAWLIDAHEREHGIRFRASVRRRLPARSYADFTPALNQRTDTAPRFRIGLRVCFLPAPQEALGPTAGRHRHSASLLPFPPRSGTSWLDLSLLIPSTMNWITSGLPNNPSGERGERDWADGASSRKQSTAEER
jgi:hypothetical protein